MRAGTTLLMAGRRPGGDPLAESQGRTHKATIPVAGIAMIDRVLAALEGAGLAERVVVCTDAPAVLSEMPGVARLERDGRLEWLPAEPTPSASVAAALDRLAPDGPLLVTTADHPLLSAAMLRHFADEAARSRAPVAVAVVEESVVRERFPEVSRTFIPLRRMRVTGANMFAFRSDAARPAIEFWARAEAFRKRPWRLVSSFGPRVLLRFVLRRLDLDQALREASRAFGVDVAAVRMPFAECALDIDRAEHLALAEQLLAGRDR